MKYKYCGSELVPCPVNRKAQSYFCWLCNRHFPVKEVKK